MVKKILCLILVTLLAHSSVQAGSSCDSKGVWLQVLGSGGPELNDQRASSGYLVWLDGKARLLVDMGAGSLLRFEQSGAGLTDLDVILISHFHVDHTNDLPALIKASFFSARKRDLPLYGPTGNELMPSATQFVQAMFGQKGAFRYLNSYLDGSEDFRLLAHDVDARVKNIQQLKAGLPYTIHAVAVHHGPIPALAWRVDVAGKAIVFSGDMNNDFNTLARLAKNADIFVAHHAVAEAASGAARNLHMPPSVIGQVAAQAGVKQLVLSHRMNRTLGQEKVSGAFIRRSYSGPLYFADDLSCFRP